MAKVIHRRSGLDCRISSDDITTVKASAVVVGEAPYLDKDSLVTQTLIDKIPMFKERHSEFKEAHRFLDLWSVKYSYLGTTFKYVIHAVMDKGDNEIWVEKMKTLYHRVFREAELLRASTIALPVLGTGVASADHGLAVRALVASALSYNPQRHTTIIVVSKDKKILDETETQFLYQLKYPEKKKGILKKITMAVTEFVEPCPHRECKPPKANADYKVKEGMKPKRHSQVASDKELEQVLKQSAREAEQRKKAEDAQKHHMKVMGTAHQLPRNDNKGDGYKKRPHSNNCSSKSFSKEDYDLQRAIALSKREAGVQIAPGGSPDPAPALRGDTSMGDKITCPICLCGISDPKQLDKCGHVFCTACIERSFLEYKPVCPSCNMVYGEIRGNQPDGQMDVGFSGEHLPGYESHGTITITYYFSNGWQKAGDPNPGQPYKGTTRRAYLPDNKEGKEILALLRTAFERRLTFTIGRSTTTGKEGVVTWNDIHHKTSIDGGPTRFGYPDSTYLFRVRDELASKGVTKSAEDGSSRQQTPVKEKGNMKLKDLIENHQHTHVNQVRMQNQMNDDKIDEEPKDTPNTLLDNPDLSVSEMQNQMDDDKIDEEPKDTPNNLLDNQDSSLSQMLNQMNDDKILHDEEPKDVPNNWLDNPEESLGQSQEELSCSGMSSVWEIHQKDGESEEDVDPESSLETRFDIPETNTHGGQNPGHDVLSAAEVEKSDRSEIDVDFLNISKDKLESPKPVNKDPTYLMSLSDETGHQKDLESEEQNPENNTNNETVSSDKDVSDDEASMSILGSSVTLSVHEHQQQIDDRGEHRPTEQMLVLKDSEKEDIKRDSQTTEKGIASHAPATADCLREDRDSLYEGNQQLEDNDQDVMPQAQDSTAEDNSDGEDRGGIKKKSLGDDDDDNPDEPTYNHTQNGTQDEISGTGYTETGDVQEAPGEKQPERSFIEPCDSSYRSIRTNSDSSDSFEIIESPQEDKESFQFMSQNNENTSLKGSTNEEELKDTMTNMAAGDSSTEQVRSSNQLNLVDLQINGEVNDSINSFEIIDMKDNPKQITEHQSNMTSTETDVKQSNILQTSPEDEQTNGQEGHCEYVGRVDGNTDINYDNKPVHLNGNTVHDVIRGNQPDGQMDVGFSGEHLPGYEGHGTITITYYFPSGTQGVDHPNPGRPYKGTTRRAYIPDTTEGKAVLKLLQKAFERKLTFTIGQPASPGQDNVVAWTDIHHKTNKDGGPTRCGYPDPTYLQQVREELADKGVADSQDETTPSS